MVHKPFRHIKFLEFAFKCQKDTKFVIRGPAVRGFCNLIFCVIERIDFEEKCQIILTQYVIPCPAAM
jgi:hypothetical protein